MKEMLKAPSAVPVSNSVVESIKSGFKRMFGGKRLDIDLAKNDDDSLIMTDIDWDTKVFIGKGIAKGKTDLFNILMGLAGVMIVDENGQTKNVISYKRFVELMEQTLGLKLTAEGEDDMQDAKIDPASVTGQNPIGNNDTVQKPQQVPENLMSTMPQFAGKDNRRAV
jgi:hypothetical protein